MTHIATSGISASTANGAAFSGKAMKQKPPIQPAQRQAGKAAATGTMRSAQVNTPTLRRRHHAKALTANGSSNIGTKTISIPRPKFTVAEGRSR